MRDLLTRAGEGRRSHVELEQVAKGLHALVARIAGNRLAAALTQWVGDVVSGASAPPDRAGRVESVTYEQHAAIVRAIEQGDPATVLTQNAGGGSVCERVRSFSF